MMYRVSVLGLLVLTLATHAVSAQTFSLKSNDKATLPKSVKKTIADTLNAQSLQFLNDKGELLAEIWFRKEIPSSATETQINNGLTYAEIPETTLLGVIEIKDILGDYRKQKIKAGVFTMRLCNQPMDGDHMGTAPFGEFVLLVPAGSDQGKATVEVEGLHDLSKKAGGGSHPGVLLLFPVAKKDLGKEPSLAKKEGGHWVLSVTQPVDAEGKKATIGIGLTLIGFSPSA